MKRNILFILLTFVFLCCNGKQTEKEAKTEKKEIEEIELPPPPRKIDMDNLIGFACYSSGMTSKPVETITKLLENENYSEVKNKLASKSVAEKYLATIACNELKKQNAISLSISELKQIEINMNSNEKTTICSGCTNENEITLKQLFSTKTFIERGVKEWLKESI
ncbi:hypothetical protein SAMN05444377_1232 [Flavobacterium fontis]|uniref:Uncharacterized protein n=1 Tax=Flavobacterium fontis TaxID=1124188 RepID=A0A1M5EW75_9FLAO|nr:hypothetical protein [Flavobacterium fontis]SHF83490.1 hypothetical protein SAMN05444377_1232 [Flavobacterium fontis]